MIKLSRFLGTFALTVFLCAAAPSTESFLVQHVSDGDTLILDNGQKVRLIGVDTPEMDDRSRNQVNAKRRGLDAKRVMNYSKKAKEYTKKMVQGRRVRLEYDWQRTDKYGRILAYVYRLEDDLFLNRSILEQGYGFSYNYFPYKYSGLFQKDEERARKSHKGLWAGDSAD